VPKPPNRKAYDVVSNPRGQKSNCDHCSQRELKSLSMWSCLASSTSRGISPRKSAQGVISHAA